MNAIKAASAPRPPADTRLVVAGPPGSRPSVRTVLDLPSFLSPGDLLVVNDAATLPASLRARTTAGHEIEVRLAAHESGSTFTAVLFGAGDWRTPTEHRPAPPPLDPGALLSAGGDLATVVHVSPASPRLVRLRFSWEGERLWTSLFRLGRPVQYSYLARDLDVRETQTPFATRPWAMEAPSASFPFRFELLSRLARRGIRLATVTHAAGLSSTGDDAIDRLLPLPERWEVPPDTARAVTAARRSGHCVIAVGTTVVRALEAAAWADGTVRAGSGVTSLRLGPGPAPAEPGRASQSRSPRAVDGLLSGLHEPGSSHFELLRAFAPEASLLEVRRAAEDAGLLAHEFGDLQLVLRAEAASRVVDRAA